MKGSSIVICCAFVGVDEGMPALANAMDDCESVKREVGDNVQHDFGGQRGEHFDVGGGR